MSMRLRSPIAWVGGKGLMVGKLLKLMPPHRHYVEVFGGGASLLFAKKPAGGIEVYNDLDEGLVHFFRMLRDPKLFWEFYVKAISTPYSRLEYIISRAEWEGETDPIERAYKWFITARMSFGGIFGASWGYSRSAVSRGMAADCSKWLSILEMLPYLHARFMRVQVECRDWKIVLKAYDAPGTLIYIDPPYLPSTLRDKKTYKHMLTEEDHVELVEAVLNAPQMILLSGYPHCLYDGLETAGWIKESFQVCCSSMGHTRFNKILGDGSGRDKQPRTECTWINYDIKTGKLLSD